ncbi:Hsp20/alpha crystallin family protein [Myxococcota bacterium]|nr:Hsp20/alpha crystallin family protein [Myxococcota bacterium]
MQIPADIYELDSQLIVEIDLPGISPHSVDFLIEGTILCIRTRPPEIPHAPIRTYHRRRRQRIESRLFGYVELPESVDPRDATASLQEGVLTLRLQIRKDAEFVDVRSDRIKTRPENLERPW